MPEREIRQTAGSRSFSSVENDYAFLEVSDLQRRLLAKYAGEFADYLDGYNGRVKSHDNSLPLTAEYLVRKSQGLIESGIPQNLVKAAEIVALRAVIEDLKDQFSQPEK